ncbi:PQ-loop-domain-containing protein [Paxillus ammoniavirescens]|nr:PQ-loop-domain-containing protein [Paxillus ammoniavirescens]
MSLILLAQSGVASSVLGWISIACWILVYSPQIIENYQLQSGEGLSLLFIYTWLLGDLCNLVGAVMARLLPTVIILGAYYTLCDSTLLFQIYYYRWKKRAGRIHLPRAGDDTPTEQSCLLGDNALVHGAEIPQLSVTRGFLQYMAAVAFVTATGVVAYLISERVHHEDSPSVPPYMPVDWRIQAIGWTSATLYLGSRLPQILKNCKTRCEGLAPGLFLFAILGNATYALSIIVVSTERSYLIRNASWLAGSTVTIFLDLCVLCQFFYYEFVSRQRGWIDTGA